MRSVILLVISILALPFAARGEPAPDWTLATPEGSELTLSESLGDRHYLLFFWATWCPYCKALSPHLQSIAFEYGDEVEVLAINIREDGDPVAFLRESGYTFTLLLEGDAVANDYGVAGTPAVFIVDREGEIDFDLSRVQRRKLEREGESLTNRQKAARRAPYWAAAIRAALDRSLAGA